MKKVMKVSSNILTIFLFLLLLMMTFIVITSKASGGEPEIFGHQLKTVQSGSMEPTFKTGSVIAIKPLEETMNLTTGDIITYLHHDGTIVTHRVMDVIPNGENTMYQTKGDNNADPDMTPVLAENVVGKYADFTIPYLGYFIDFAKSSKGAAILLIVPGFILIGYSAIMFYQVMRQLEKNNPNEAEEIVQSSSS